MKNKIIINLSKDTPPETVKELGAVLRTEKQSKRNKQSDLYALNEDIEKLHERYEQLYKQVKTSLNLSEKQIEKECDVLSEKYDFEIAELSKLRKVDYDIRLAEIREREHNIKPWRRCWLWRLLFKPLTNRAQDIIEARAELDADIIHMQAEEAIENDKKKLPPDDGKKLSKRKLKRIMREKFRAAIEQADNADVKEAFTEPNDVPTAQADSTEPAEAQKQEQMRLDVLPANVYRARPPRNCRKQ